MLGKNKVHAKDVQHTPTFFCEEVNRNYAMLTPSAKELLRQRVAADTLLR